MTGLPLPGVLQPRKTVPERDIVQPQGAQRTGYSSQARRRLYAVVALFLAPVVVMAADEKKKAGPILYEEQSRSRIVYHEEKGGMARPEAPAQEPSKDRAASTTPKTTASASRTAQRGDAVAAK